MSGKGRKILVAVDEGEESAYALSWCLKNLLTGNPNYENTLILLYAKQPSAAAYMPMDSAGYMSSSSIISTMERYSNQVAKTVMDRAKRICDEINAQVRVETMVEYGDPRDVICEAADKLKVDFLIMGSRGYGVIKRALLGSVSTHCAHNVNCPVMIVKKPIKP
ncbi:Adenine nucleotide alpha hydrolases-like superfamily protein [Striga hermonthica]|uniref:Adenine nucleotide alpha hydrolases-like superfamily protein n=1 Tax=Striga hermonthica TaxID=68872 RepID=A0A9N7NHF0_STRHE|nr:Adenine nucleotide alpha hydrolases-like superfamily protein [Striga hermonthica]